MMASYDYLSLQATFANLVSEQLGMILIELNTNGKQLPNDFIAFDIISPYITIDVDILEQETFESIVSFTAYSRDKIKALNTAQKLRKTLSAFIVRENLRTKDIIVVDIMNTQSRAVVETDMYAYMVGFDTRLRLRETFVDDTIQTVKTIEVKEN